MHTTSDAYDSNDATERINEHREDLEALAESDLPASDVAEVLLEVADE
ncbi:hypothetical protein [Halorussus marinus]|nr:hypothetical protein [Halorussus marinus]